MTGSTFILPTAVTERVAPLNLTVAPEPQLPATVQVAGPQSQRAIELTRNLLSTFDTNTGSYGDGMRSPISRFANEHSQETAKWSLAGMMAGIGAAAVGGIIGTDLAATIGHVSFFAGMGSAMVAVAGPLLAGAAERVVTRKRVLGSDAVAPIRAAFDAAPEGSLDRAVITKLAHWTLDDLNLRNVRGEPPRALLRSVIADGARLPQAVRDAGNALLECYTMVHNDRGQLVRELSPRAATKLEHALARASEPQRTELRTTLMTLLFKDERLVVTAKPEVEARLYRVLTGEMPPRQPPIIATPVLEGEELQAAARELQSNLFDADGDRSSRPLTAGDARTLFALLRSTGTKAAE